MDGSTRSEREVREFVELHGGSVRARSPGLGFGSEFIVRLPIR
jgi:signal transduction histidine kinase